jgi:hypothetical protein
MSSIILWRNGVVMKPSFVEVTVAFFPRGNDASTREGGIVTEDALPWKENGKSPESMLKARNAHNAMGARHLPPSGLVQQVQKRGGK